MNKPIHGYRVPSPWSATSMSLIGHGSPPELVSMEDDPDVNSGGWPRIRIDGTVLNFATDWDLVGVVESHVLNVYGFDRLRPGSNVLDVGAGIGDFSVLAARRVGPTGRVIAIEPNPEDYTVLTRNLRLNDCDNVTPMNVALSESEGIAMLEFKGKRFPARTTSLANAIREVGLHAVDFVKMDIEGFEAMVVPSSLEILGQARYIAIELHGDQELAFQALSSKGFQFTAVDTPLLTARLVFFAFRHPIIMIRLYSRVKHYPPYSVSGLLRRILKGPSIAQEGKLLVGIFSRSL